MKVVAIVAGVGFALITAALALSIVVNGHVYVPGRIWARGYVGGIGAYAMAISWLCLGSAAVLASLMYVDRKRYFEHRHWRDILLVGFGAFFVVAVMGVIVERANPGAF